MNLAQAAHARPPGDPGGANVLRLADVTVRFGGITAVDAVTLDVPGGQVVGLIGPNGASKTTLLDSVSGLRTPPPKGASSSTARTSPPGRPPGSPGTASAGPSSGIRRSAG
ncbi:ATP-binding cassette domain-containing protein [Nonomuraea ferruginea]